MKQPLFNYPKFIQWFIPIIVGIFLLVIWELACLLMEVPPYIVPKPSIIAVTFIKDFDLLFHALWITLKITFFAFAIATILGTMIAFLFIQSKWIEISFFPYIVLLQVTPIAAIAPLIIIWVKDTNMALIACATIISIFPIISNTTLGLRSVNVGLMSLFKMHNASRLQKLFFLQIPTALPFWFASLRISSGLSLIGAVVAEFVAGTGGQNSGLAYQILQAGFQINIPRLFAALFLISVAGIILFSLMTLASKLSIGRWHESEINQES